MCCPEGRTTATRKVHTHNKKTPSAHEMENTSDTKTEHSRNVFVAFLDDFLYNETQTFSQASNAHRTHIYTYSEKNMVPIRKRVHARKFRFSLARYCDVRESSSCAPQNSRPQKHSEPFTTTSKSKLRQRRKRTNERNRATVDGAVAADNVSGIRTHGLLIIAVCECESVCVCIAYSIE